MSTAPEKDPLQEEFDFFNEIKEELLKTDSGRWVVIKGQNILGKMDTFRDAQVLGIAEFGEELFFIGHIVPDQFYRITSPRYVNAAN